MKHSLTRLIPLMLLTMFATAIAGDKHLKQAISGEHRSEDLVKRDTYRHPEKTLKFFGIKPNMTVVEIFPGGGYYAEILANYLMRGKGHYIAGIYDTNPETQKAWMAKRNKIIEDTYAKNPELYGKVSLVDAYPNKDSITLAPEGTVDLILDFRNAHNWYKTNPTVMIEAFHKALKKGGIVGVIDHRWPEDKEYNADSGYIKPSMLIEAMEKHGFQLVGRSEINANPKDTKDHERGVWTLPPSLSLGDKDRDKYLAIGESDRMTLKFRKK